MTRPCTCDRVHADPARPYTPDQCRLCWLYRHDPAYRALWVGPGDRVPPCRHLGEPTGGTVVCPGCCGVVALKLFACAIHGRCTPLRAAPPVPCCLTCPDRRPAT